MYPKNITFETFSLHHVIVFNELSALLRCVSNRGPFYVIVVRNRIHHGCAQPGEPDSLANIRGSFLHNAHMNSRTWLYRIRVNGNMSVSHITHNRCSVRCTQINKRNKTGHTARRSSEITQP